MEKLKMLTPNLVKDNIEKIKQIFPDCITEHIRGGQTEYAIDFDKLRQELSGNVIEGDEERYQFTWPGKKQSIITANAPISKTLRPCREESLDFDNTENLYIEGDNLDVLKLLREDYLGKVKMIYIDPPYNTGNDFVYEDDFSQSADDYIDNSGQQDDVGNHLVANTENNGRFHTDWLNMIYARLKVTRDFLSDDGVIFISIDDNEIENLRKICDEIFGANNFVAQFVWRGGRRNLAKYVSTSHEYMLCFAKSLSIISDRNISWNEKKKGLDKIYKEADSLVNEYNGDFQKASKALKEWYKSLPDDEPAKDHSHYCWIDRKGVYFASDISRGGGGGPRWEIINPNTGNPVQTPSRGWSYSKKEDLLQDIEAGLVHFNGDGVPCKKRYLRDNETQVLETVFYKDRRGSSQRLRSLMGGDYFPFPKDEFVIENLLESFTDKNSLVLDFFSGSSTTAHAVFLANSHDNGCRKFIMVQIPEKTEEKSNAFKAGFTNICEIGKERIRLAGKKILEEQKANQTGSTDDAQVGKLDIGFRVLKVDSSNMKDVYYKPSDVTNDIFAETQDNIKEDRTDEDLLFQVMLELAVPLSAKIRSEEICGRKAMVVDDNYLIACFDRDITDEVVTDIAKRKPQYFVMRDSSAVDDSVITNFETIFQTYSKDTVRKIL